MKLKSFLYLLLFALPINLLAQKITGQIINEFDNTPVFGVTIYSDGVPFAFSDQEGKFEIEDISKIKELTFSHLAFTEKTLRISDFKTENQMVYLQEKATMLKEVEITTSKNPLSLEDIVKKSSKKFIENYKTTPYYANVNAKQIVMENNIYKGYLEMDGLIYNFIPKQNNTFQYAYIIPRELRKSTEKLAQKDYILKSKEIFNYFGADYLRGTFFLNFQSINLSHPLFRKHKYSFKRLEDVEINGNEYYQIQFFQKRGISVGRDLFNIYGEMLISKEDFFIVKHKISFDFDKSYSNEFEIVYDKKGDKILPSKITSSIKLIGRKLKNKNTFFQTHLIIDNSKTIDSKDINLGFQICYYLDELKYDANYWQNKHQNYSTELINNYLKTINNKDFEEGAKQKQIDTNSKYYTNEDKEFIILQIKKHEEILKNIKL
jgi:hypothetical protein